MGRIPGNWQSCRFSVECRLGRGARVGMWGEGGKQKTRARGWIGIGRNRQIGEEDKLKENVCITSLHSNVSVFPKNTQ